MRCPALCLFFEGCIILGRGVYAFAGQNGTPPTGPRAVSVDSAEGGYPARYRLCLFGNFGAIYLLWVKADLALRELLGFLMRCRLGYHFLAYGLLFV